VVWGAAHRLKSVSGTENLLKQVVVSCECCPVRFDALGLADGECIQRNVDAARASTVPMRNQMFERGTQGMASGVETGKFGVWLSGYLGGMDQVNEYKVFWDHGDQGSDLGVVAVKGFYGDTVANVNRLADIDVLVADGQGHALLLIEIEERPSSPKKIIGDVFAVAMCNRIEVKQSGVSTVFDVTPETTLIVAGIANQRGDKMAQARQVIYPRMGSFSAPADGLRLENVRFVFHGCLPCMIAALEEEVRSQISYPPIQIGV
jgi:hypothetical protein